MDQLIKRRKEIRVEIRRQQCEERFSSLRRNLLESSCSQAFIAEHLQMVRQGQPPSIVVGSMLQALNSHKAMRGVLSQACAYVLAEGALPFWKEAQLTSLSQLLIVMFSHVGLDIKNQPSWQPFIEYIAKEVVGCWMRQKSFDSCWFEAALSMHCYANKQSKIQYTTFEEELYRLVEDAREWLSEQELKVLLLALKRTPSELLATKTKAKLYGLAKGIYYREVVQSRGGLGTASDFVLQVLRVRRVQEQHQNLLLDMLDKVQGGDYRVALQVLKLQTHENDWVTYEQVRHTLKRLSTRLTSNSDTVHFLKILHNLIINELQSAQPIRLIYQQYFSGKLEVYLQSRALAAIFAENLSVFTEIQPICYEAELAQCALHLLQIYHSLLQRRTKFKLILWLLSREKINQCEVSLFLSHSEALAFFRQLENTQQSL